MFIPVEQELPALHTTTDRNGFYVCESMEVIVKTSKGKHFVVVRNEDDWVFNPHSGKAEFISDLESYGEIVSWKYVC